MVSALHSRCPDLAERRKLAESVYEEETGKLSGSKAHPELFLDLAAGVGLRRDEVRAAEPLPSTAALIHWFEYSTKILPFLIPFIVAEVLVIGHRSFFSGVIFWATSWQNDDLGCKQEEIRFLLKETIVPSDRPSQTGTPYLLHGNDENCPGTNIAGSYVDIIAALTSR